MLFEDLNGSPVNPDTPSVTFSGGNVVLKYRGMSSTSLTRCCLLSD